MAKILIVDDSPIVTKVIEATLRKHGMVVEVSNSSFGVSNKVHKFRPEVLLMDLGMPGLSGNELLGIIKSSGASCHTIIISSAPEADMQSHVRQGLADDYYIKGTPLDLLVDKIRRYVTVDASPAPAAPIPVETAVGGTTEQLSSWRDDLRIGVEPIDSHHREIFRRFDQLMQSCSMGKGREDVSRFISFLREYITYHFAEEESIQVKYAYPGYADHRREHERFAKDLATLEQMSQREGSALSLVIQTNKLSLDWLMQHITVTDKALGVFLDSNGIASAGSGDA